MKIYQSLTEFVKVPHAVVTIGTFDGVHVGHQQIIKHLKAAATLINGQTVILTFFPHPRLVLYPHDESLKLLNTLAEKIVRLTNHGIDHLFIHPFSNECAQLSYHDFVEQVLVAKIGVEKLVIGYDHRFGKDRAGSFEQLRVLAPELSFMIDEIPEQDVNEVTVSSTKIRTAIVSGDVSTANSYLGYNYMIEGVVVKGKQLGRSIGFPTANISLNDPYKLVPAIGIYAVLVGVENTVYKGMMSIGTNPTVGGTERTIEVNILDFDKDIYGQPITVYFRYYMRPEIKFDGIPALQQQLHADREHALALLGE